MFHRNATVAIDAALADTRVILVAGPRQSGKSTLARELVNPGAYRTLDDSGTYSAAQADPTGFVNSLPYPVVIDEIHGFPNSSCP